jgi:hypothetical protein
MQKQSMIRIRKGKDLIFKQINESAQPYNSTLRLDGKIAGGSFKKKDETLAPRNGEDMFTYDYNGSRYSTTNLQTRDLIVYAITPLSLKYKINAIEGFQDRYVDVSWSHWNEQK